ncbi:MAG: ABC transporter permease [Prevotellaceae bacterium]|jgi:putative ABC transport system permease protein|nr:ABC transporter permease [Prevotellaceae bacterium]
MIDLFQEIFGTIRRNKLRTFLTGFAVAWGIFMLIVLLGAGNGLIHAFEEAAGARALNSVNVSPGWTSMAYDGLKADRRIHLDNSDVRISNTHFPENIMDVGATVRQSGVTISYGKEYINQQSLTGVYPGFIDIATDTKIIEGRFINEQDIKERRKVIVLFYKNAEILFPAAKRSPIGQHVKVGNVMYQVVGLFDNGGNTSGATYVPFTTLQTIYNKGVQLNNITFTIQNLPTIEANEAFEAQYRKALSANHRFDPTDTRAVWISNRLRQYMQSQAAMSTLTIAIWVIGIFTLLSGIVGVSNIMLITVKERTHEFGIRKALGAKPRAILWLIIVESVFITTLFGYFGMVAGIGATEWMNAIAGQQTVDVGMGGGETIFSNPTVDLGVAIQATLTLIIAGALAGFFPARKAVSVSPIEALRAD